MVLQPKNIDLKIADGIVFVYRSLILFYKTFVCFKIFMLLIFLQRGQQKLLQKALSQLVQGKVFTDRGKDKVIAASAFIIEKLR